jgi:hypothetical protein
MKTLCVFFLSMLSLNVRAQQTDTIFLKRLLESHPELFQGILNHPMRNEVQILYTQIDRDKHNRPYFKPYSYRLNPTRYFYPASTVKLPTLIFALEKIHELNIKGLTKESVMITDSSFNEQTRVTKDTSAKNGLPSIGNYGKKILLVSDNDAYNRLYEFVGREEINKKLQKYGLKDTRIVGRLAIGDGDDRARHTNPVRFYNGAQLIYAQPEQVDNNDYPVKLENLRQGNGYLDRNNKLVMEPFDFTGKNVYPLNNQQAVLKRLLFPEAFPKNERFNLTADDYKFLYKYMSLYPTESEKPTYHRPEYFPAYCKFLFYGGDSSAVINPDTRIFNKIGDSYGYDIDNAYIVNFKTKTEFLLSVVIQSNEDGIYNDNKYEYATICLPFMKNIAQLLYQYELIRPRKHPADLRKYQLTPAH